MLTEQLENDLDAEFRQILCMIKPYINDINDHYRIEKYRVWLEKLSNSSSTEKLERNKYLVELANQIHDNILKPPFVFNPPRGPLPKLRKVEEAINSYYQEKESKENSAYSTYRHSQNFSIKTQNDVKEQIKKFSKYKPFHIIGRVHSESSKNSETSSWCDLSDSATDAEERKSEQNEEKKQDNEKKRNDNTEIEALKTRMRDLIEVKNVLKEANRISEQRKITIDKLHIKLLHLQDENSELRLLLDSQRKKFIEVDRKKTKELLYLKDKFRQKEIECLKNHTDRNRENTKVDNSQSDKTVTVNSDKTVTPFDNEIQSKIELVKNEYDQKIKELTESNEHLLNEKEEEIRRLKNELKNRGDYKTDGQQTENLVNLKKCLEKLDKALHKNEKEYTKKIERLKQDLEIKEMTSKMQLETQKADLIIKNSTNKHEELRHALDGLEEKYMKMIENIQLNALEAKKRDKKVIQELQAVLNKHNITY